MTDTEMINWLEQYVRKEGGLVLHMKEHGGGPYAGLGLEGGFLQRDLRTAITRAAQYD